MGLFDKLKSLVSDDKLIISAVPYTSSMEGSICAPAFS